MSDGLLVADPTNTLACLYNFIIDIKKGSDDEAGASSNQFQLHLQLRPMTSGQAPSRGSQQQNGWWTGGHSSLYSASRKQGTASLLAEKITPGPFRFSRGPQFNVPHTLERLIFFCVFFLWPLDLLDVPDLAPRVID